MNDTLRRDDTQERTPFETLSSGTQKALRRAASYRKVQRVVLTAEQAAEIDRDWLMVPSKRGPMQVVVVGGENPGCWHL